MALNENITTIERFTAIIQDDQGRQVMSLRMAEFMEALVSQVNQNIVINGTGSPEGVITAQPFKFYIDTAAASGSNLYAKTTGAGNTGWVLV